MELKVDYVKVSDTGKDLEKENKSLSESLEDLLKIIEDLRSSWDGVDYNTFKRESSEYIVGLNKMIGNVDYLAKFMKKAAVKYSSTDNEWAKTMKKIGAEEYESKKRNDR